MTTQPTIRLKTWRDIDLSFTKTGSNDVASKTDLNAIKQQLKNVLACERYDVPFHPEIAAGIRTINFDLFTDATAKTLQAMIKDVITQYVKRVSLQSVSVTWNEGSNELVIDLNYTVAGIQQTATFRSIIYRAR